MATKDRFLFARIALLAFGLAIVVLAALFLFPNIASGQSAFFFTTVNAIILFSVLVGPLLMGERIEELTAGRIVSLGMVFRATIPFALCTLALTVYANTTINPPIKLLVVAQLILLFILALWVYFGMYTSTHINDRAAREREQRYSIDGLQSLSSQLVLNSTSTDNTQRKELVDLASSVKEINEELHYITHVTSREAEELERQIESCLSSLLACYAAGDFTSQRTKDANNLAHKTLTLIRHRRTLRN